VTRSVDAMQRGRKIFEMQASFALEGEEGPQHQVRPPSKDDDGVSMRGSRLEATQKHRRHQRAMPLDVPPPESLPSAHEVLGELLPRLPAPAAAQLERALSVPIDFRFCDEVQLKFECCLLQELNWNWNSNYLNWNCSN
jgi:acyl-CoA thioesterase